MPLWDKTSNRPKNLSRIDKRSVVATDKGWVKRITYTDVHANERSKDEILVPLPGLANSTNMGAADIDDMWFSTNNVVINNAVNVNLVFNEPIRVTGAWSLSVANTAGGSAKTATSAGASTVVLANNNLVFTFTPTAAGTYKIQAQTIANTSTGDIVSRNTGTETASKVITGAVSNTAGIITVTAS